LFYKNRHGRYNEGVEGQVHRSIIAAFIVWVFVLFSCSLAGAFNKPCEFCHVGHTGSGMLLSRDVNGLCSGCHQERLNKGEHRVGMSPPMVVKDLPLYSGKMACPTCHDPHAKASGMLRKPVGELCLSCHDK
jgi:predicted CXXCH cytochrome family protein